MKTEAAVLTEIGAPLELVELEVPELRPGQVLVEIAYSGVCHSQVNEWMGRRGPDPYIPHAMGHEASGHVLAVGEGVSKVRAGDVVVLSWLRGEGADVPGTAYESRLGAVNAGGITTFQRHSVVSENRLVPVPGDVDLRTAALLGCAVPTGAGAVFNALRLGFNERLAVFGCGGVGLMAIMAGVAAGAALVIAVDVNPDRLAVAESVGATHVHDARSGDPVAAVRALTEGRGVDAAIEAAGLTSTMEQAVLATREGGGRAVLAGNPPAGERLSIDPFELIRGRHVTGTWGGNGAIDEDVQRYLRLVAEGKLPVSRLLDSELYELRDTTTALEDLAAGRKTRPLLRLAGG